MINVHKRHIECSYVHACVSLYTDIILNSLWVLDNTLDFNRAETHHTCLAITVDLLVTTFWRLKKRQCDLARKFASCRSHNLQVKETDWGSRRVGAFSFAEWEAHRTRGCDVTASTS